MARKMLGSRQTHIEKVAKSSTYESAGSKKIEPRDWLGVFKPQSPPPVTHFFFLYTSVFFIFINLGISYLHFDCYSLSLFPGQHPYNPFPILLYRCSPSHPPLITALTLTITFTGGSVLAEPRAFSSTGAFTRIFIDTYEVGAQGQSMYSLWVVA